MRKIEVTYSQGPTSWNRAVDLVLTELTADEAIQTHKQSAELFSLGGWMVAGTIRGVAAGVKFYPKTIEADYPDEGAVGRQFFSDSDVLEAELCTRVLTVRA